MFSESNLAQWIEEHQAKFDTYLLDGFEYLKLVYTTEVDQTRRVVIGIDQIDCVEAAFQLDQVLMELTYGYEYADRTTEIRDIGSRDARAIPGHQVERIGYSDRELPARRNCA